MQIRWIPFVHKEEKILLPEFIPVDLVGSGHAMQLHLTFYIETENERTQNKRVGLLKALTIIAMLMFVLTGIRQQQK